MKRFTRRTLLALLLVFVYILWHPQSTRPELTVEPHWAIDLRATGAATAATASGAETPGAGGSSETPADGAARSPLEIPVQADGVFAYLDERGTIVHRGRATYRVALSPWGYINYARHPEQLVVQRPNGEFRSSIPLSGYPFFVGDRLLVVSSGGGTLSEWTLDGRLRWQVDLPAPVLSVAATEELVGLGMLAGGSLLLGPQGSRIELQRPAVVTDPVVYAVSVSADPARFAVAAADGLSATVTLYDVTAERGVPVVRRSITRDPQAEPLVRLVDDGHVLVYSTVSPQQGHRLVSLNVDSGDDVHVSFSYPPVEIAELAFPGLRVGLGVSGSRDPARGFARPAELLVLSAGGLVPVRAQWAANITSLRRHDSLVLLRVDDRIVGFSLEVR